MKNAFSQKLYITEVSKAAKEAIKAQKGVELGSMIKIIRTQLGMSQQVLAERAGVPQPAVSNIEGGKRTNINLSTLQKILNALSCDLVITPLLNESIEDIRRKQAREIAKKHLDYLKGTMSLEQQQPDPLFIEELLREEEERLLRGPKKDLWR